MSEKMKAVVMHNPETFDAVNYNNNYEVKEIDKPECGDGEILLKMKAAALCGTDKRIFTGGKTKGVRPNSVVGHEICGVIEKVGKDVKGFAAGDHVA
ncbi:MAG: alcohol dehydrogenase catalytic domain-containing protein, partial [Synergistaceae bacterium]|nr:alcohol dehydrogenase catalytic domain-containing protein [Synergistaceae bacterium]